MSDIASKVVYTALTRMTEDREAIKQAFQNWHAAFHGQELDVFAFVEHIENYLGLDTGEKKVLMMSMHAGSSKGGLGLKEVPEYILGLPSNDVVNTAQAVVSDDQTSAAAKKPPYILLSEFYFSNMLAGVQKISGKMASEIREILADEGLPNVEQSIQTCVNRISDDQISLPVNTQEPACKAFCLEVYMLVCEVVGPMNADDISYKAIAKMLETNEASRYDPRALI